MKRLLSTALCVALGSLTLSIAAEPALASDLCVGGKPGCFATIQAAVDAAQDGDAIRVGPGTFAGGITIDKSVSLVGMSAGATTIEGGGPVLTIGDGTADLTVSISRVTITGGFNDSKPESQFGPGFFTAGGGVLIEAAADNTIGATVTISDSVISGNRVTAGPPQPLCDNPCSFASGGGIANWGTLTVMQHASTTTSPAPRPPAAGLPRTLAAGASGTAGVGVVTLRRSFVTGNRSAVSAPNGRFAEGGGINDDGTLTIEDSIVNDNSCDASTAVPNTFPLEEMQTAVGGGIRITDWPGANATITRHHDQRQPRRLDQPRRGCLGQFRRSRRRRLAAPRRQQGRPEHRAHKRPALLRQPCVCCFRGYRGHRCCDDPQHEYQRQPCHSGERNGTRHRRGHRHRQPQRSGDARAGARDRQPRERRGRRGVPLPCRRRGQRWRDPEHRVRRRSAVLTISDSVVTANELTTTTDITPRGGGIFSADVFTGDPFPITMEGTVIQGNKPDQCFGC